MKPLYKQEVHHFGDLYPTSKAHESLVIRNVHSETKSQVLSLQLRGRSHCFQQCHEGFQICYELKLCLYMKKIGFFLRIFRDMFEAINEESFVRLLTCPSMFLYDESELATFVRRYSTFIKV